MAVSGKIKKYWPAIAALAILCWIFHYSSDLELILLTASVITFIWLSERKNSLNWIIIKSKESYRRGWGVAWSATGLITVAAALCLLEFKQNFYFVQDDTHAQYFPVILAACRQFFNEGTLPTWNAYIGLGLPISSGGYALTYPFLYLSYLVARLAGNELYMIEFFAWAHLLGGYCVMYVAVRQAGVRPQLAAAAAAGYVLAGYHLVHGRSWFNVLFLPLWSPILLLSLINFMQCKTASVKWIIWTGLAIGGFFYCNHIQFWFYPVMFWGMGMVLSLLGNPGRNLSNWLAFITAGLLGVALAMPLLLVNMLEYRNIPKSGIGDDITRNIHYMVFPWINNVSFYMWKVRAVSTFSGLLLIAAFVRVLLAAAAGENGLRQNINILILPTLFLASVLLGMGTHGGLWQLLSTLPPLAKFTFPEKLLATIALFGSITGALMVESIWRRLSFSNMAGGIAAIILMAVSFYNASNADTARYSFADKPYPAMPEQFASRLINRDKPERVLMLGPDRSRYEGFVQGLSNNYAAVYNIFSANWYNQRVIRGSNVFKAIVQEAINPIPFMQHFGIRWLIEISERRGNEYMFPDYDNRLLKLLKAEKIRPSSSVTIGDNVLHDMKTPETEAMVHLASKPLDDLKFKVKANGLVIDIPDFVKADQLIATFFYYPWFHAYNEAGVEFFITTDKYGRITMKLDDFAPGKIYLLYKPPFLKGIAFASIIFLIFSICLYFFIRLRGDNRLATFGI